MAASSLSAENFKMPTEPFPLPSLGSDEESFVVLWKDMDGKSIVELNHEPIGTSIVEEAKQLINKELTEMEKSTTENKVVTQPDSNLSVDGHGSQNGIKVEESNQMEKSSHLPKMPQVEKGFDTSEVISITTLSTDLTSEQVEKKVSEIVEENIRLKDTILQNNMSMKSQYERIVAWQEDVQKVHQAHKEKIIEAKEFIDKLKKENYNLHRELEQLKAIKNAQEEEISSLKQNKDMKQLELGLNNLTVENEVLKEDGAKSAEANIKVEEHEKEIDRLQTALRSTKIELEEAKLELTKMKSPDEEKYKSLIETVDTLRSQLLFTKQQQTVLPTQEEVANFRKQLSKTQVSLAQAEQARDAACFQVENLRKENLELKAKLEKSAAETADMYTQKAKAAAAADEEKYKSLMETVEALRSQLFFAKQQQTFLPTPEEVANIRQQLSNTQVQLTQVEHARNEACRHIESLRKENLEMKTKLEKSIEADDMYALKAQLDVYKADFEAERNAKETIKTEKEKLSEDMQNLQRRNQQLQEEIELLRENEYVVTPSIPRERHPTPSAPSVSSNEHPMKCPVCSFGFKTHQALENHVYRCLELADNLP